MLNEVVNNIIKNSPRFGIVDWSSCRVSEISHVTTIFPDDEEYILIVIDECSPDAHDFFRYILERLKNNGYKGNYQIRGEW